MIFTMQLTSVWMMIILLYQRERKVVYPGEKMFGDLTNIGGITKLKIFLQSWFEVILIVFPDR